MDPGVLLLLLVLLFAVAGSAAGLATGLVPGLHVNNVVLLVASGAPALLAALAVVAGDDAVLLLAAFLAAASVSHGIASLLPSVFLGAPDSETALTVLPGHRMLARGKGMEAVLLGARGALLAVLLAIPLVLPFRLLLGPPVDAYDRLRALLPFLLLLLVAVLLATEGGGADGAAAWRKRAWAVVLLGAAGLLGILVLTAGFLRGAWAPLPPGTDSLILFPLFTGLFGLPTLILSMGNRGRLPPQDLGPADPLPDWRGTRGVLTGAVAGASVSWIPGLGGTNATVVAQLLAGGEPREDDPDGDREFLYATGAANAATAVFTLAALFIILRARSGVAAGIDAIAAGVPAWEPLPQVPTLFATVLIALVASAALAYIATVRLARPFAILAGRIRYGRLARAVALALTAAVFVATGPLGLLVLGTATGLGLVPPLVGVRRVHLMGCLLVPLLAAGL